jgi:hypothetical protein
MKELIFILIFFYVFLVIASPSERYIRWMPTWYIYPDNEMDAAQVLSITKNRNTEDERLFRKTDESVVHAFVDFVDEDVDELRTMITQSKIIMPIYTLKYTINRPRPYQINSEIKAWHSDTGNTPSYPAGHAFQAYYLCHVLTEKYPAKQKYFEEIARKCDEVRVKAGIHYVSDGRFAKEWVERLKQMNVY